MSDSKNFSVVGALASLDPYTPPPKPYWNTSRSGVRVGIRNTWPVPERGFAQADVEITQQAMDKYDALQMAVFFVALAFKLGHEPESTAEAFLAAGHFN